VSLNVRPLVPSRVMKVGSHSGGRAPRSVLGGYIALMKLRVVELLLVTTVPTMVLADDGWPDWWLIVITLIGGTLAAGGANAINMYVDRDIDALMERTKHRPLVTGLIAPRSGLTFAIFLEIAAFTVLWVGANLLAAILAISATLFYVFVYTLWLKRTSTQNIVIGGAAGAMPVLVGWAAVTDSLAWAPWVLFAVIFFWTPPHFWALAIRHADDYRAAGVPMLPVVVEQHKAIRSMIAYTVVTVATSFLMFPVSDLGWIYGISAGVLGAAFLVGTIALSRRPTDRGSMQLFTFSITYLSLLFIMLTVDVLVG